MKTTTLRLLVGVTAPLILTGSVKAAFTGISSTSKPNPFGLLVVNVYANFDRPGEDQMIVVAGTPSNPQGNPFDAVNSFPGNGQVLIGQFSTADGTALDGTMLITVMSNGVIQQVVVNFFHVPGPGALWLLGATGLLGSRRRRRGVAYSWTCTFA